jgi:hypothetical protein
VQYGSTAGFNTEGFSASFTQTSSNSSVRQVVIDGSPYNERTNRNDNQTFKTTSLSEFYGSSVRMFSAKTDNHFTQATVSQGTGGGTNSYNQTLTTTYFSSALSDRFLSESFSIVTESRFQSVRQTYDIPVILGTFNIVTVGTGTNTSTTKTNAGTESRMIRNRFTNFYSFSKSASSIEVKTNLTSSSSSRFSQTRSQGTGENQFTNWGVNSNGNITQSIGGTNYNNTGSSQTNSTNSTSFSSFPTVYDSYTTTTTTRNTVSYDTSAVTLTSTALNTNLTDSNSAISYTFTSWSAGGTNQEITIPTTTNSTYESRFFADEKAWTNISYYFGGNNGGFVKFQDIPNSTSKFNVPFSKLTTSTSHPIAYFPRANYTYSYSYNNANRVTRPSVTANSSVSQRTVTGFPTVTRAIYTDTNVSVGGSFYFNRTSKLAPLYTTKTKFAYEWDNPTSSISNFTEYVSSIQNGTEQSYTSFNIATLTTVLSTKTCFSFSTNTFSLAEQYQKLVTTDVSYLGIGASNDTSSSVSATRVNTFRDNQISFRSYGVPAQVLIATLRDELGTGLGFQSIKTNFTKVTGPPLVSFTDEMLTTSTFSYQVPTSTGTFYNTTTSNGATTTTSTVASSTKTFNTSSGSNNSTRSVSYAFSTDIDKSYKNHRNYIYSPKTEMLPFEAGSTSFSSADNSIKATFTSTDFYFSGDKTFSYSTLLFGLRDLDQPNSISTFSYPEAALLATNAFQGGQNIIDSKGTVLVTGDNTISNMNPSIFTDTGNNDYISFNLDSSLCQSKTISKHRICRLAATHALIKDYEDFGDRTAFMDLYKSNVE